MPNMNMAQASSKSVTPPASSGEPFTITCFTCGMPSSKEWAQRVRARPSSPSVPFYPFILQRKAPGGAAVHEDGSTFLCAFCAASLEAQWQAFEKDAPGLPKQDRAYNIHKFVCAVCSVSTYRKRVRALPFQEFPFLAKERQPGSLTLGDNPLAIVCLDCSETLWSQSAEYDRWGLPVQKRHFNWMLRPPPPENSMEATVARLPSGETQLPRCPPTEPLVVPRRKDSTHYSRSPKPLKPEGLTQESNKSPSSRKSSSSSAGGGQVELGSTQSVPVVTVAPMSSHHNTPTNSFRKDSVPSSSSSAALMSGLPKYEPIPNPGLHPDHMTGNLFSRGTPGPIQHSYLTTGPSYGSYHWSGRDIVGEPFPFQPTMESRVVAAQNTNWTSWLPPSPQADLLRYQSYLSSIGSRSFSVPEPYYNPHAMFPIPTSTSSGGLDPNLMTLHPPAESTPTYSHSPQTRRQQSASFSHHPEPPPQHSSHSRSVSFCNEPELSSSGGSGRRPSKPVLGKLGKISEHHRKSLPHINPKKGITKNNSLAILAEAEREQLRTLPMGVKKYADKVKKPERAHVQVPRARPKPARTSWPATVQTEPLDYCAGSPSKSPPKTETPMDLTCSTVRSVPPKASANFMISFLCGESTRTPPMEPAQESRDSVIVSMVQGSPLPASFHEIGSLFAKTEADLLSSRDNNNGKGKSLCEDVVKVPEIVTTASPGLQHTESVQESELPKAEDCPKKEAGVPMIVVVENDSDKENPILDEKTFVERAIQDYKKKEAENLRILQQERNSQKKFLNLFELVTVQEKSEIELKVLESRFQKRALPPLKLRPKDSQQDALSKALERQLFMTAFEDTSLKASSVDPKQLGFMSRLGLKQASKSEKYRREQHWRIMLTERIMRERRGPQLVSRKRPWDNYSEISKHLLPFGSKLARRNSTGSCEGGPSPSSVLPMRSLSVTLPPFSQDLWDPYVGLADDC